LTRAHAAVVRCALGERAGELAPIVRELEADPGREGYGHFVLGLLYGEMGEAARARHELTAFVLALARARLGPARTRPEPVRGRVIPLRGARRAR
jgi:hypothetical protein